MPNHPPRSGVMNILLFRKIASSQTKKRFSTLNYRTTRSNLARNRSPSSGSHRPTDPPALDLARPLGSNQLTKPRRGEITRRTAREGSIGPQGRRARGGASYLVGVVELVVHEAGDDGRLAHGLVAQEHQLVLGQRRHHRCHGIRYVTRPAFFFFWLCWRPRSSLVFREGPDACS